MLFQTFDDKEKCHLVYKNGTFHDNLTPTCTKTWSYANYMKNREDIEYANLFVLGKSLAEVTTGSTKGQLLEVHERIKAVIKASIEVGLSLNEVCIYDLIPSHYLTKLAHIKDKACQEIFENYEKPANYDQLLKIVKIIADIKSRPINIDISKMGRVSVQDRNTYNLLKKCSPVVSYDMTKTVTGRLTTKKDTFPVMTLAKKYRNVITPSNNWLFEMDFNACELRTALALLGQKQPEEDLHDWNLANVFTRAKDRNNAKKRIFAWLYNPNSNDDKVSKIYDRKKLKELYYDGKKVVTPFGREIECDDNHAISYLIQSTAADLVFEQIHKLWKYLDGKKSFIKFCNHDSVMIDFHKEEEQTFHEMRQIFGNTRFGKFKATSFGGKNWLDMKQLLIN